jgi:hypothetical protein
LARKKVFEPPKTHKNTKESFGFRIFEFGIYRVCGAIMIIAILIMFAGFLKIIPEPFYSDHHFTFWMETLAVESFGFSWLIKGKTLFQDIEPTKKSV